MLMGRDTPVPGKGRDGCNSCPPLRRLFWLRQGALAFGKLGFSDDRTVEATLSLKNISDAPVTLTFGAEDFALGLTLVDPPIVYLAAGSKKDVAIALGFERTALPQSVEDFSGFVEGILTISNDGGETSRVPIFALRRLFSQIQPSSLYLGADSKASLSMVSQGDNFGIALPFNLLGMDEKKAEHRYFPLPRDIYSRDCDMESVGYRIVTRSVGDEKDGSVKSEKFFQVATKIYSPLTRWKPLPHFGAVRYRCRRLARAGIGRHSLLRAIGTRDCYESRVLLSSHRYCEGEGKFGLFRLLELFLLIGLLPISFG